MQPNMQETCCPQYTIRLPVNGFTPTASHRKIVNRFNRFLDGSYCPPQATALGYESASGPSPVHTKTAKTTIFDLLEDAFRPGHRHTFKTSLRRASLDREAFDLFKLYQATVHDDKATQMGYNRFLVENPLFAVAEDGMTPGPRSIPYGAYHAHYRIDGKLVAVAVLDILPSCVSSVYFFYDPAYKFLSLGVYSALSEIHLSRELGLPYYYMGFYIHSCDKMNYKAQYHPSDLLDPVTYQWHYYSQWKDKLDKSAFATFVQEIEDIRKIEKEREEEARQVPQLLRLTPPRTVQISLLDDQPDGWSNELTEWITKGGVSTISNSVLIEH